MNEVQVSNRLDELASIMKASTVIELPLVHRFTPGLYIREIFMPKGAMVISKIHKTTHPFVISKGRVSVWTQDEGVVTFEAPYTGITHPGTQRVLYMHSDVIWTTFHPTNETDPLVIESQIIQEPDPGSVTIGGEAIRLLQE